MQPSGYALCSRVRIPEVSPSIPGADAYLDNGDASRTRQTVAVSAVVLAIVAPLYGCFTGTGDAMTIGTRCGTADTNAFECYDDVDISISCILLVPTTGPMFAVGVLVFYLAWLPRFLEYADLVASNALWRALLYAAVCAEVCGALVTIFVPIIGDAMYRVHLIGFISWVTGALSESALLGLRVLLDCGGCVTGVKLDTVTTGVVTGRAACTDVSFVVILCAMVFRDDWGPLFRVGEYTILVLGLVSSLPMLFVPPRKEK